MQNEKIESLFVNFILKLVGPTEERENERNSKYTLIKTIIEESLIIHYPNYIPHIFLYGSFPIKIYLKDSDIDITIIFEDKQKSQLLIDLSQDEINKILSIIKDSFDKYNNKNNQILFTDINIINADIQLLKCIFQSIPIDISINNFLSLFKIIFMNNIFNLIGKKLNKNINEENNEIENNNKLIIFKRTILLIKAWCSYEGSLMGSNIGLMASYGLEVLIIYMFNLYYKDINNEIDGFFCFFNLMKNIDIEKNIISLFGLIPINEFHSKLFNSEKDKNDISNSLGSDPIWYINKNDKNNENYLFNINEIKEILVKINFKIKDDNIFKKCFIEKLFNILDPINSQNNLGKSINYHSFSKMKNVFKYIVKELNKIIEIKQMEDPFLYINSLLKLFYNTLSMNFIELFINYLNLPKIIVDSKSKEGNNNYNNGFTILRVNKEEIKKFNKLYLCQKSEIQNNENNKENDYNNDNQDNQDNNEEKEEDESNEESNEENDIYEEEEDKKIDNYNKNINESQKKNIEKRKNDNVIKYENYDLIINNEIFNKLFELSNSKNNNGQIAFYDNLNKISNNYFLDTEKFLAKYNIV